MGALWGKSKKMLKILVSFCLILLLLPLSACLESDTPLIPAVDTNLENPEFNNQDEDKISISINERGQIPAESLVQAICLAINRDYTVEEVFRSLPRLAKQEISEEDFRLYLNALKPVEGERITAFKALPENEAAGLLSKVLRYQPHLADLALTSQFYRLDYQDSRGTRYDSEDNYFVLAVQQNDRNGAYLSSLWMEAIQNLYLYSSFYFDAIENEALAKGETRPLAYLIKDERLPLNEEESSLYTEIKSGLISDFYREAVSSSATLSKCRSILPGYANFMQEYRYGSRLSGIREVEFNALPQGGFVVKEHIPEKLTEEEKLLTVFDKPIFAQDALHRVSISNEDLHPLVGPVEEITLIEGNTAEESTNPSQERYLINYFGLSLTIQGQADIEQKTWSGKLQEIRIHSKIYALGEFLQVGKDIADFYYAHPFYTDNNAILQMNSIFSYCLLTFNLEGDQIAEITLRSELR